MKLKTIDLYRWPANILLLLGCVDLLRGFMHTFVLTWSATNFAQLDLTTASSDQLFLLGIFGISNWLTGMLYILISRKARELSPYVLIIIPAAYLIGLFGIGMGGVHGQAAYDGKYFMLGYFAVCIITFLFFLLRKRSKTK